MIYELHHYIATTDLTGEILDFLVFQWRRKVRIMHVYSKIVESVKQTLK